ncbi:MAG TPA: hypothetical protein VF483_14255 [Gemmatimonadaceae bacterium]
MKVRSMLAVLAMGVFAASANAQAPAAPKQDAKPAADSGKKETKGMAKKGDMKKGDMKKGDMKKGAKKGGDMKKDTTKAPETKKP